MTFLKVLFTHTIIFDINCPDGSIWVRDFQKILAMSPKNYNRYSRLQKSPLLREMFA